MSKYDDIINLKRPISKRCPMSMENRAAQFAPFSALTGYSEAIKEVSRITDYKKELSDGLKEIINEKLRIIKDNNYEGLVTITYFVPDGKKSGGVYKTVSDYIKKIDINKCLIILKNDLKIPFKDICDVDCCLFNIYEL